MTASGLCDGKEAREEWIAVGTGTDSGDGDGDVNGAEIGCFGGRRWD